jgi:hypothetical protein
VADHVEQPVWIAGSGVVDAGAGVEALTIIRDGLLRDAARAAKEVTMLETFHIWRS